MAAPLLGPELIAAHHDTGAFDCGHPALDTFLSRFALVNQATGAARNTTAVPRSGSEPLDAERRRRPSERRVLGRERQSQAHGKLEVTHIVSREALLTRERQHVPEPASRQVGIDADVELAENSQELNRARLRNASALLSREQNVPDLQFPDRRDVSRRGAQAIEKRPRRRSPFVIEAPRNR